MISGVDFFGLPTRDLDDSVRFYGEVLGLKCSVHMPERHHAEFETGNLTLNIMNSEAMGLEHTPNRNALALHVDDVAEERKRLEAAGVEFQGGIIDTGVCHMAFFADPQGNALMLHHRYAPKRDDAF